MIVVVGDYGQLGNRLVVFAHLIAAARTHDLRLVNLSFQPYAHHFTATARDACCRYPATRGLLPAGARWRKWLHAGGLLAQRYVSRFHRRTGRWPAGVRVLDIGWEQSLDLDGAEFARAAAEARVLILKGWLFRARESLARHADAVRQFLTPLPRHQHRVAAHLRRIRQAADLVVGVHIRQGDYRQFENGRYCFDTLRYVRLMREARESLPGRRVAFLVCSTDPQPPAAFGDLEVYFGPGSAVEDLYALAGCDLLIGPPSTFSEWASFYGHAPLHVVRDATSGLDPAVTAALGTPAAAEFVDAL